VTPFAPATYGARLPKEEGIGLPDPSPARPGRKVSGVHPISLEVAVHVLEFIDPGRSHPAVSGAVRFHSPAATFPSLDPHVAREGLARLGELHVATVQSDRPVKASGSPLGNQL